MAKRTAVVAVNPVNGMGLFQYLETFFENKIPCTVFAVAESREIRTNSGIGLTADDVIANLKGHEEEYDALVFACGDAVPVFAQHAGEPWNRDLMEVLKTFGETGKPMIGHCAAGMMFGFAGVAAGRRVAVHPMAKAAVTGPVATDAPFEIDGNFFTAQEEHAIPAMIGRVGGYGVRIEEVHHTQKLDAPSGTAITLAEGILDNLADKQGWVNYAPGIAHATNRVERSEDTPADRIEIRSVREGAVPGIHTVTYESEDDMLELKHTIKNRRTLAMGAVVAAEFLCGKQGVFGMDDLLRN